MSPGRGDGNRIGDSSRGRVRRRESDLRQVILFRLFNCINSSPSRLMIIELKTRRKEGEEVQTGQWRT